MQLQLNSLAGVLALTLSERRRRRRPSRRTADAPRRRPSRHRRHARPRRPEHDDRASRARPTPGADRRPPPAKSTTSTRRRDATTTRRQTGLAGAADDHDADHRQAAAGQRGDRGGREGRRAGLRSEGRRRSARSKSVSAKGAVVSTGTVKATIPIVELRQERQGPGHRHDQGRDRSARRSRPSKNRRLSSGAASCGIARRGR